MELAILHSGHPSARKEHTCMYCGGTIHKGETYCRNTIAYDGRVYDWVNHCKCEELASLLDMYYRNNDDGLDGYDFDAFVWDAIENLHPNRDVACDMNTEQRVDWLMAHRDKVDEYMKD